MAEVLADLVLNVDQALSQVDELGAQITAITGDVVLDVAVEVEPIDDIAVDADISAAEAEIQSLDADPVEIAVDADTTAAQEGISELGDTATSASGGLGGLTEQVGLLGAAQAAGGRGAVSLAQNLTSAGSGAAVAATGIGALGFATFELASAYGEAESVATRTDLIIQNTGGNANVTASEVASLASEIQAYSGFSDEAIASGANFALGLAEVRNEAGENNDIFDRLIKVSADYAAFTGGEVTQATTRFGRALNDPVRGLSLLRRTGVTFTQGQQDLVASLVASGDVLEAQKVILDSLEGRYQGTARALGETLPGEIDRAKEQFGELAEEMGGVVAPAFVGAAEQAGTFARLLAGLRDRIHDVTHAETSGGFSLSDIFDVDTKDIGLAIRESFSGGDIEQMEDNLRANAAAAEIFRLKVQDITFEQPIKGMEDLGEATERTGDAAQRLGDEWAILDNNLSDFNATLGAQDALRSLDAALVDAREDGSITAEEMSGLNHELADTVEAFRRSAEAQSENADGSTNFQRRSELLRASLGFLSGTIDGTLRPSFRLLTQDILNVPRNIAIRVESNAAFVAREFELLAGTIANAGAIAASHQADFHASPIEAAAVLAPTRTDGDGATIVNGNTIVNVDARGAKDPQAVGDAVAEALGPHRRKVAILTRQRSG